MATENATTIGQYSYDVPEDFLVVPSDAGFPIDAITCTIARAESVVLLLHELFDGTREGRPSDYVVANALWSVEGSLQMLKTMISDAYQSVRQEAVQ